MSRRRSVAALGGLLLATSLAEACSTSSGDELVGSSRQALQPELFDLPDHGETKVRTGFRSKPTGSGNDMPDDPSFCFFTRIKGPFIGRPPFDSQNDPSLDTFVSIRPVNGEWVGEISATSPTPEVTIGCVRFSQFKNAGNIAKEGSTKEYAITGAGALDTTTGWIPGIFERTPSFCTFNFFQGNLARPYNNCTTDANARVVSTADGSSKQDTAELIVRGMTCEAIDYPLWCLTCPNDQPRFESQPMAAAECNTRWSGMSGKGLIQFGSNGAPSFSGTGTALIPTNDGVCWISAIGPEFGSPNEEAVIAPVQFGNTSWWVFTSTSNSSARATCILTDQAQ
jgi:hypothetical protein